MPDVKVFLSSTYRDLDEHRKAVIDRLRRLDDVIVVCMEEFGARARDSKETCLQKLEPCHLYVGIFGCYYGSVPKGGDCSMTELEYRTARDNGTPQLAFVSNDDFKAPANLHQSPKNFKRQQAFRGSVMSELTVDFFANDPQELANAVAAAVTNWQKDRKKRARKPRKAPPPPPSPAPASPTGPLHQLPSDIPDFTGRATELDALIAALDRDGGSAAVVTAIRGMGGIGKTALAVHAARRLVPRYPDAQIVVNLQGYGDAAPLAPLDIMTKVVQAFEPSIKPVDDPAQMTARYLSVLNGKRALILLDNAPAKADLRALVPPPPGCLIVTARGPVRLDGATAIPLGVLSRAESLALLRSAAGRTDVADAEWDRIAGLCGDLPLALRVAGSFLAEAVNWTAAAYIRELADERKRFDALKLEGLPDRDVGAVLGLSAQHLVKDDPALVERWQTLSVFPADFDEPAAAAVWKAEPAEARRTLTALLTCALLLFDTDERRYRLHDLLRPIARQVFAFAGRPDPEPGSDTRLRAAAARHARHFMGVLGEAKRLFKKGGDGVLAGLRQYDREARNIGTAASWAMENAEQDRDATDIAARLPDAGVYVLDLRLHQRQRIEWLDDARRAARALELRGLEGNHLGNLGLAYAALGETRRAIEHHEQALAISREIGDRRGEASDLGNLGLAYAALGETRRAIEHHEQDIAIRREIGDRHGEGNALGNLGLAYAALGETRRAIERHEQALVISREIGDRRGEGSHLGNLGCAYAALGETRRAIEHHEQALAICREIGDRRGEGIRLGNLGSAYAALGETRRAIEHYEQALAISREIGDRRGEGNRLGNLGGAYATLGETRRAIELGEQALAIFEAIESPHTGTVRGWLAKWRGALGVDT